LRHQVSSESLPSKFSQTDCRIYLLVSPMSKEKTLKLSYFQISPYFPDLDNTQWTPLRHATVKRYKTCNKCSKRSLMISCSYLIWLFSTNWLPPSWRSDLEHTYIQTSYLILCCCVLLDILMCLSFCFAHWFAKFNFRKI